MSKDFVDQMVHNMKLASMVTKAAPWMVEGIRDQQKNVRYVGIALKDDWLEIFPAGNNVLMKFVIDRSSAYVEYYIANKPPFFRFFNKRFSGEDKWELLLGDLKRRLKKDKNEVQNHKDSFGNLYLLIKPHLKNP